MKKHRNYIIGAIALSALVVGGCVLNKFDPYIPYTHWGEGAQKAFYTQDQGSRLMPLAWFNALKMDDGSAFSADQLTRYGYLEMPDRKDNLDLPVGFTTGFSHNNETGRRVEHVGMTCAACHTREIHVEGSPIRIDGGPAFADFQTFQSDLNRITLRTLNDAESFDEFALDVLGESASDEDVQMLRKDFARWSRRFDAINSRSLPQHPMKAWGPARLDAISMIFNRVTGLGLGAPENDYIIEENIQLADAPTRYPFLWNAAIQDKTQWPGFSDNGDPVHALGRNAGEVYGVFGDFRPLKKEPRFGMDRDYIRHSSINFRGLLKLEKYIRLLEPPKWQWPIDDELVQQGHEIYQRPIDDGGCVGCHMTRENKGNLPNTIRTPLCNVHTDVREMSVMARSVADAGVLNGARIPFDSDHKVLAKDAPAADVLGVAVSGTIAQWALGENHSIIETAYSLGDAIKINVGHKTRLAVEDSARDGDREWQCWNMHKHDVPPDTQPRYESRNLEGIWAAAPYLHNGSVPTLRELLKPDHERVTQFKIGSNYDIDNVGLAVTQDQSDFTLHTTGCADLNSGNSNCGHNFGTDLPENEKRALLEYLKQL